MARISRAAPLLLLASLSVVAYATLPLHADDAARDAAAPDDACATKNIDSFDRNASADNAAGAAFTRGTLRVAFWNIRDLSSRSRNGDERETICDVIARYDVVGVAEVVDRAIIADLEQRLDARGSDWSSAVSERRGNSRYTAEHYALFWRSDRVDVTGSRQLDEVTVEYGSAKQPFDREPWAVFLRTDDGHFDCVLVLVHVTWGRRVDGRIAEVRALLDYQRAVQADEPDALVLGDLNRNTNDARSLGWLARHGVTSTTATSPATKVRGDSTYDHILLDRRATTEYRGRHGVDCFDERLFGGDHEAAHLACSDHRPVWIELTIPDRDDD